MNCHQAQRAIQFELDGELSSPAVAELDGHVQACPACRERRHQFAILQTGFKSLAAEQPSLIAKPKRRSAGLILALAACLAVLITGSLILRRMQTSAPPAPAPLVSTTEPQEPKPPLVEVTIRGEGDEIIVPVKTKNPNITVIWVYPARRTADGSNHNEHTAS